MRRGGTEVFLLVGVCWLVLCAGLAVADAAAAAPTTLQIARSGAASDTSRTLRYRFELRNGTAQVIDAARFWTFAPVARSGTATLLDVTVSHPATVSHDARGIKVLDIDAGRLPPHGLAVVTVTARVAVASGSTSQRLRRKRALLAAGPLAEVTDPDIVALADTLRRPTAEETGKAIYQWVVRSVGDSGFAAREQSAARVLATRQGDCSDMAWIFVALSRAAGVPARYLGGYVVDGNALLTPDGFHNWAEFHDGDGWRVADPQARVFDERPGRYVGFNLGGAYTDTALAGYHRFKAGTEGLEIKMLGRR